MRIERDKAKTLFIADSFRDLADCSSRSRRSNESSSESKSRYGGEFYTEDSFESALDKFVRGDSSAGDHIEKLREQVRAQLGDLDVAAFRFEHSLEGRFLDVGAFVAGEPEYMLAALEDVERRRERFVRIVVDTTFTSDVPREKILTRGGAIVALCDALNLAGYSTEVHAVISISPSGFGRAGSTRRSLGLVCPVQTRGETWDTRSAAFPLSNGDYLRRVMFGIMEGLPQSERDEWNVPAGYGTVRSVTQGDYIDLAVGGADIILPSNQGSIDHIVRDPFKWIMGQCQALGVITSVPSSMERR